VTVSVIIDAWLCGVRCNLTALLKCLMFIRLIRKVPACVFELGPPIIVHDAIIGYVDSRQYCYMVQDSGTPSISQGLQARLSSKVPELRCTPEST
jgi:hypothetical protein